MTHWGELYKLRCTKFVDGVYGKLLSCRDERKNKRTLHNDTFLRMGLRECPCRAVYTLKQWTPQGNSFFNLDPTRSFFRNVNNRTAILGRPHKPDM